ncbi:MAG: Flp pilus assembly protein CpaB [Deltaproteobacteria bacterium]|nr:Flp pilus assembly protein CpaB [Deltaproteobacteria bacterium]
MKIKLEKRVIVSMAAGLMAALIISLPFFFAMRAKGPERAGEGLNILIAARDIPQKEEITQDDVSRITILSKTLPPGVFVDPNELKGKKTSRIVKQGEIINALAFAPEPGKTTGTIPPGYVAAALRVDSVSGVGGMIKPGDRVDIIGVYTSLREKTAKVILQAVEVIFSNYKEGERDQYVTLLIRLEDVQKLSLIYKAGEYMLALRGGEDNSIYHPTSLTASELYAADKKPEAISIKARIKSAGKIEIVEVK